ncbi:carabin-like, partial [Mobula birostris]|uniref:carabin-like n=1 Tax=Mobula birostris TaxID=1983395 RepID=UPI003B285406
MEPRTGPPPSSLAAFPLPPSDSLSSGLDSLSLAADGGSSLGSDSEINGGEASLPNADRYGFVGGSNFTGEAARIPAEVIREREKKWLETEQNWERSITRRYKKIMLRCRKGIPSSMRSRIWPLLCGAKSRMLQNKNIFKVLDESAGDRQWLEAIEKDLHRQFPFHEMFLSREGTGQQDLYRVLKAYTVYKPEEGYCQAQGPLAAVLLMQMPAE